MSQTGKSIELKLTYSPVLCHRALSILRLPMCSRWRVSVVRVFMVVSSGLGCLLPSNGGIALASLREGRTPKEEEIVDCTMQTWYIFIYF